MTLPYLGWEERMPRKRNRSAHIPGAEVAAPALEQPHRLRRETGVSREFGIGRKLVYLGYLGAEKSVGSWYGVS